MDSKRILVTGAAGFLGSHLCRQLLALGHHVVGLDNLSTGSQENIRELLNHSRFKFIFHDVVKPIDIDVDYIANLACPASPRWYQADPIQTMKTAFLGTLHMLELAQRKNAVLLQASTSEVYGSPEQHPQHESYWGHVNPIGIRSCYDEGKRAGETLCFDFNRTYGVPVKVVRIFNTYGPYMSPEDGRVVSSFIVQALEHKPLVMFGDGLQTRSFCYVDDLIRGLLLALFSKTDLIGPFNVGNPQEVTLLELARIVLIQTKSSASIIHDRLPEDDPPRRRPDISRMFNLFAWQPEVSLEMGIAQTIAYFKRVLKNQGRSDRTLDHSVGWGSL